MHFEVAITVGGTCVGVRSESAEFAQLLRERYFGYLDSAIEPQIVFKVELATPQVSDPDLDATVEMVGPEWVLRRGDFHAVWNPATGQGTIRQAVSPYAIDSVLRIVHTLLLVNEGGFLLHASSVVRNGKAYLFSGLSGAGKTTMARLAPPDVAVLTDEASYVRKVGGQYLAYGTPFAGELGAPGKNISAPIAALLLLGKSAENSMAPVAPSEAVRRLMRNILFFANDPKLVGAVFDAACAFAAVVPVRELLFFPDARVWELIG